MNRLAKEQRRKMAAQYQRDVAAVIAQWKANGSPTLDCDCVDEWHGRHGAFPEYLLGCPKCSEVDGECCAREYERRNALDVRREADGSAVERSEVQ